VRNARLYVMLLGCAAIVLGALALIRSAVLETELLGGGLIANGIGLVLHALP